MFGAGVYVVSLAVDTWLGADRQVDAVVCDIVLALVLVLMVCAPFTRTVSFWMAEQLTSSPCGEPRGTVRGVALGVLWVLFHTVVGSIVVLALVMCVVGTVEALLALFAIKDTVQFDFLLFSVKFSRWAMVATGVVFTGFLALAPYWLKGLRWLVSRVAVRLMVLEPVAPTPQDRDAELIGTLTEREREVLALLVNGKTNKEIASEMFVTDQTVKSHVSSILIKLGVDNRTQAACIAIQAGMTPVF
jgi:DNA-binding CsgD family transcriptional regulator